MSQPPRAPAPPNTPGPVRAEAIEIVGANEHNLRGVDLRIPRDQLIVITGLSGSGKSSLAFDTIHQEGQRRFMESLSSYARQFLGSMEKPHVERVDGLSPTLCIDQKTVNRNPRSTVGTVTEILDHLRLLMSRLGQARCPICLDPISSATPGQIADNVLRDYPAARLHVMGPVVQSRKGEYRGQLASWLSQGFLRARIDDTLHRLDEGEIPLGRYEKHTIELVCDRLKARPDSRARLVEAIERALALADGQVSFLIDLDGADAATPPTHRVFSASRACPKHSISIPEMEPRLFSFNAPQGMCLGCAGIGWLEDLDLAELIDPHAPFDQALRVLDGDTRLPFSSLSAGVLRHVGAHLGAKPGTPWSKLGRRNVEALLFGADVRYTVTREREGHTSTSEKTWAGILPILRMVWKYSHLKRLAQYRRRQRCPDCAGQRLNPIALAVQFRDRGISELVGLTVKDARDFFGSVRLTGAEQQIGAPILRELNGRLAFLFDVGLGYLGLDRASASLSGGEAQRIRLAGQVGAGLQGVTYVLDEPSIGLHARDQGRLLDSLCALRDRGNTVIIVEHDPETMARADWLIEVGPGAGKEGGQIVAQGRPAKFRRSKALTAKYLRGELSIPIPTQRRVGNGDEIRVVGARGHNLQSVDFTLPLGTLTVVTGVSGSGKSTLVRHTLTPALAAALHGAQARPGDHDRVEGIDHIDKVVTIDQDPIGRTPRSNPATYTGAFDPIRDLFARLPESRARGWKKGRFSFNVSGGRCEECQGAGVRTIEMQFLANVQVLCEACNGRRFNPETLELRYRGRTITDVLEMRVEEAARFFKNHKRIRRVLDTLVQVGLGYVQLGQPSTTLSGGEAQRIKLATELSRPATGRTLYVLDEPTTGLHMHDVGRLIQALQALVDAGNTVLVIEHDADVIKSADHLVDLGPDGGEAGGTITGVGTPESLAPMDTPTGALLRRALGVDADTSLAKSPTARYRKRRRQREIRLEGVQTHNLQDIDVTLPEGQMTVITGPSGSGKTSLAFDTLFAEGQRRYVESLSTYARRFLGRMGRAPVRKATGLAPAIAIDQRNRGANPRSTVATVTEIQDSLRLLYARIGVPHCPQCHAPLRATSPSTGARLLAAANPGTGWLLCTLPAGTRAADLQLEGFSRVFDGKEHDLAAIIEANGVDADMGGWQLVTDRVNPARTETARLSEAIATAYGYGDDRCTFRPRRSGAPIHLTRHAACPDHGRVHAEPLTPRHFSFNSHLGACVTCSGLGRASAVDPDLLIPNPHLALGDAVDSRVGAVAFRSARTRAILEALITQHGVATDAPVNDWPPALRRAVLRGSPTPITVSWTRKWGSTTSHVQEDREWAGLVGIVQGWSSRASWLRQDAPCPTCDGGRLQPQLLAVTIGSVDMGDDRPPGHSIASATQLTITQAREFWQGVILGAADSQIAEQPVHELLSRLKFLEDVGLEYLTLDRSAETLSGGESQRIRLATQLGARLTGTIYVLDEPTIGLHPRDTARLLGTLSELRDLGNTLVVVEHDPEVMRAADYIIDMGPGAGEHGGHVVDRGTPAQLAATGEYTGAWLGGRTRIEQPAVRRDAKNWWSAPPARMHNLQALEASIPRGCFSVVTGVSGSGKSTLIMDHVAPWLTACAARRDTDMAERVVVIDQKPIGRSPRSTPATYADLMGPIRKLFASHPLSKERGYTAGRFAYNGKGEGRCGACEGRGAVLIEMHFLSDVWVTCDACGGRRYNRETLEVRWAEHSIADVLDGSVHDALALFIRHKPIARRLQALVDVGLGYVRLGQPGTTLSGGEAQRMKLASELVGNRKETVFLLDEPTTGLHLGDVAKLLSVLQRLVDQGHTVVVIEHHLDVILASDHVIDVGPDGGAGGGQIVATGTPETIARVPHSATGEALRVARPGA